MKKIIHKLKKNRLVSKIAALLTICMILVSSFTVSSFAADEEEVTNSITDVWTGVTDSIISLFGSAQGVFLTESGGSNSIVLNSSDLFEASSGSTTVYTIEVPSFDISNVVPGDSYTFSFLNQSFDTIFYDDSSYGFVSFRNASNDFALGYYFVPPTGVPNIKANTWYLTLKEPFSGTATLTIPFSFGGTVSLSFLGTLAVVGVAIALIMLLVYVISRFLRLRG